MKISITVLNGALDNQFNNVSRTYTLEIEGTGLGVTTNTINFNSAAVGVVEMSSPSYFAVPSGGVITGIKVIDELSKEYLTYDVTDRTYSASGTYTVSSLSITLGV